MRDNTLFYSQAIFKLRPNSGFSIDGVDYDTLKFSDVSVSKPTKEEIEFEYDIISSEFETKEYQRLRASEYPDFKEYLDGIVKGDQAQIQAYIDACLAVKAKYPKT